MLEKQMHEDLQEDFREYCISVCSYQVINSMQLFSSG